MKYHFLLPLLAVSLFTHAQNFQLEDDWPMFNGPIHAMVEDTANKILYVGGDFTKVEPSISHGASLDTITGLPLYTEYHPNGSVLDVIPDGNGGWYIAGHFTKIGPFERNHIAHINRFGIPSNRFENRGFNYGVESLEKVGDTLYAGGNFDTYGEIKRRAGFIDINTGTVDFNFPEVDGQILSAIADGEKGWFLGGSFTKIGNKQRTNFAHIDSNGTVTQMIIKVNNSIQCMEVKDSILYLGGTFTKVEGQVRNHLAAYNLNLKSIVNWKPNLDNSVLSLKVGDSAIYVGGYFDYVNGNYQAHFAAINRYTDSLTSFRPSVSNQVYSMALKDSLIFIGGNFLYSEGTSRRGAACYNLNTGSLTNWAPNVKLGNSTGYVRGISIYNNSVFLGGRFDSIAGFHRPDLVEVDIHTGIPTSWKPDPQNYINSIAIYNNHLYVGGDFHRIANQDRNDLAAFDLTNGNTLTPWNPNVDRDVFNLAVANHTVFVGGSNLVVGGAKRKGLVGIDLNTFQATAWNPQVRGFIFDMEAVNGNLYIGGSFNQVGIFTRNYLAAISLTTGLPTSWNPNPSNSVYDLKVDGNRLFVGGSFQSIAGSSRANLVSFNLNNHNLQNWSPQISGPVSAIEVKGDTLFLGGSFSSVQSQSRNLIAAIHKSTSQLFSWSPNVSGNRVLTLELYDDIIYFGGDFSQVDGLERNFAAAYQTNANQLTNWNPDANDYVFCINHFNDQIYVGGQFYTIGRRSKRSIAAIDMVSRKLTNWDPQINGRVYALALSDSLLYVGGSFYNINGVQNRGLAAIGLNSDTVFNWNPNIFISFGIPAVNCLKIYDSKLYIGGHYNDIHNTTRNSLSAVDLRTHTITSFNPNVTYGVKALEKRGNELIIGGSFQSIGGLPIKYVGIVNIHSGSPRIWNRYSSMLSHTVNALALYGNTLYIGGDFTGNNNYKYLVSLDVSVTTPNPTNWFPKVTGGVNSLIVDDSTLFVGAGANKYFNRVSEEPHPQLFSYGLGVTNVLHFSDSTLFVGGNFSGLPYQRNNFSVFKRLPISKSVDSLVACDSLQWVDGNVYKQSTTYSNYIYTDQFGYDSIVNLNLTINRVDTSVTQMHNTLESMQDSAQYQWFNCNTMQAIAGATNQIYTATQNGNYACVVTYKNCTDTTACYSIISTAIEENVAPVLKLYPNPSTELFYLEFFRLESNGELRIVNSTGQVVYTKSITNQQKLSIDMKHWAKGIYSIRLKTQNELLIRKIVRN